MSCSTEVKTKAKKGEGEGRKVTLFVPDKGFIDKTALARSSYGIEYSTITYKSIFMCHRVGYIFTMIT